MTPPDTYAGWSTCLEVFERASEDEAVMQAMNAGSLSWTGGVANLFSERVSGVVNQRLTRIANDISRDLRFAGDHGVLANAMLNARHKLALLHRFSRCAPFPQALSELVQSQVRGYAEQAQQSLEDTARSDRSGQLATIVRNNSLLRYADQTTASQPVVDRAVAQRANATDTAGNRRRRTFLS
ncbi:hypothetical protein [Cupriavidus pampae]|uniref:Uncharacterized protein n=1 Tax=Cupriavidus pampae TaxID=659251 RepID=A0ABM8WJ12_9BURK|nr:hypothetical protein [Cupriavidus pampae]CAG9167395.1 hypothetical protein LMG32289_01380 [Cupriavidus pampae]